LRKWPVIVAICCGVHPTSEKQRDGRPAKIMEVAFHRLIGAGLFHRFSEPTEVALLERPPGFGSEDQRRDTRYPVQHAA
jgi:hypothetical protein